MVAQGDTHLLQVVLENLLNNAWKFTAKHLQAKIEFGAMPQNNGISVYFVRDDGTGFDMAYSDKKIHQQAALLDITTDAIFVRDLKHRILFWNKGAERLYGWEAAAVLGTSAIALLYRHGETLPHAAIETTLLEEGQCQGELQHVNGWFNGNSDSARSKSST